MGQSGGRGRAVVIGVGLMGGSLAGRLKALGWQVWGVDCHGDTLAYALEEKLIDQGFPGPDGAIAGADLVCLATPPSLIPGLVGQISEYLQPGSIVTDLASIKAPIIEKVEPFLPPGVTFLGGHPMTGSEYSGVQASNPHLFVGATYVLTPTVRTPDCTLKKMITLVEELGAVPVVMGPEEHDFWVAVVSHLPHIGAAALVHLVSRREGGSPWAALLAGGGFRDTTRIASSDPGLWQDICLSNSKKILPLLKELRESLVELEGFLAQGDGSGVYTWFQEAKTFRDDLFQGCAKVKEEGRWGTLL